MKRIVLAGSLVLNVVLVVVVIWMAVAQRQRSYTLLADATAAEVRLQEHILARLEAEPPEMEAVKALLRRNIEQGTRIAADWKAAAD